MNHSRLHQVFLRDLYRARPPAPGDEGIRFTAVHGQREFTALPGASALPGEPAVSRLASSSDYRVYVALRSGQVAAVACVRLDDAGWRRAPAELYEPRVARLVHLSARPERGGGSLIPALLEHACWSLRRRGYDRCEARVWTANADDAAALERCGWSPRARVDPGPRARPLRWVRDGRIAAPPPPRGCDGLGRARADLS